MSIVTLDVLADLKFDILITLNVIKRENDLVTLLGLDLSESVDDLLLLHRYNSLKENHLKALEEIFIDLILTNQTYIDLYNKLEANPLMLKKGDANAPAPTPVAEPAPVKEVKAVVKPKTPAKEKAPAKLPRRYGKTEILKDIAKQGGKPTLTQTTMLKVNDLKNYYVKLSNLGIKDMLTDTQVLSEEDCKQILSAVNIVEQKLGKIMKIK